MGKRKEFEAGKRSSEAGRNRKGQFVAGRSGNPRGRPPKAVAPLPTLAELFASALSEKVTVSTKGGQKEELSMLEIHVKSLVRNTAKATPKEQQALLLFAEKLGAFQVMQAQAEEDQEAPCYISEEDRRMIAAIKRGLRAAESIPDDDEEHASSS